MATYKPQAKTSDDITIDIQFPISTIKGLPEALEELRENGSSGLEYVAAKNSSGNVIAYHVTKGTCTDADIVIPRYHNGKPVTMVYGFGYLETVKSVHIPDTVTDIHTHAFLGCINLEKVNIPRSVTWISSRAFGNTNVKSLYIPNSVVEVSDVDPFGSVENLYIEHEKAPEGWREGWDEYPRNIVWGVPMSPLVVKSEFDAINDEIESIHDILKGKEEAKLDNLDGSAWKLNDTIPAESVGGSATFSVNFTSNGILYNTLRFLVVGTSISIAYGSMQNVVYKDGAWTNTNNQYISFISGGTDSTNLTLIDLFYEIGSLLSVNLSRLQTKYDENLNTESKEIVGAINELNEKIGEGVDTSNLANVILKYKVELTGSEMVTDIINQLRFKGYQLGTFDFVEFSGATSGLYGLTINHYGGNIYNVGGVHFSTFYTMANNVTDWSTVSLWSFLGYFQPPLPYYDGSNEGQVLKIVDGVPTWTN